MANAPLLQRVKRWLLHRRSSQVYFATEVLAAAEWDVECGALLNQLAADALSRSEVLTAARLIRVLSEHMPLEKAYGKEEAARFVQTLDAYLAQLGMHIPTGQKSLVDHDVMVIVAVLRSSAREEDGGITVARLVGGTLSFPSEIRSMLEKSGFAMMPLLRWATHNTLEVLNHYPTGNLDDFLDDEYELLLLNDSITTQELVTKLLETHLSVSPSAAQTMMLETHREGRVLLAVGELDTIVAMAQALQADARAAGFPLEVQVRLSS